MTELVGEEIRLGKEDAGTTIGVYRTILSNFCAQEAVVPGSYHWDKSSYNQRWQFLLSCETLIKDCYDGVGLLPLERQ
jgi:hypothetical protein